MHSPGAPTTQAEITTQWSRCLAGVGPGRKSSRTPSLRHPRPASHTKPWSIWCRTAAAPPRRHFRTCTADNPGVPLNVRYLRCVEASSRWRGDGVIPSSQAPPVRVHLGRDMGCIACCGLPGQGSPSHRRAGSRCGNARSRNGPEYTGVRKHRSGGLALGRGPLEQMHQDDAALAVVACQSHSTRATSHRSAGRRFEPYRAHRSLLQSGFSGVGTPEDGSCAVLLRRHAD